MNKFIFALAVFLFANSSSASFSENSRRYLSPKDMFALWTQKFPVVGDKDQLAKYFSNDPDLIPMTCWAIGARNGNSTGLTLPVIGAPAAVTPGSAFVRWWASCADKIIKRQIEVLNLKANDETLWKKYWSAELLNKFKDKKDPKTPFHKFNEVEWSALTGRQRQMQVRFLIEELIGPNAVISDLGFAKGIDELAEQIQALIPNDSTLKLNEVNRTLITAVALREEFITY